MDGYRQFWNEVIWGNDGLGPGDLEGYWYRLAIFAALLFVVGLASARVRASPVAVTVLFLGLYTAAVVPFMVWTASCTGCGASFSADAARSAELHLVELLWGGFLAKGLAVFWVGTLVARGWAAVAAPPEPRLRL